MADAFCSSGTSPTRRATTTCRHFNRFAAGFAHVANDPTAERATVSKMVAEFCNAASAFNDAFCADRFRGAVFGKAVAA